MAPTAIKNNPKDNALHAFQKHFSAIALLAALKIWTSTFVRRSKPDIRYEELHCRITVHTTNKILKLNNMYILNKRQI